MSIDHKDFHDIWGMSLSTSRGTVARVRAVEKKKLYVAKRLDDEAEKKQEKSRRRRKNKYQISSS